MTGTKKAIFFLVLLMIVNVYPGMYYQWYDLKAFDVSLHFLGGFFVSMLLLSYYDREFKRNSQLFRLLSAVGITLLVGVAWEFMEYLGSIYLSEPIWRIYQVRVYFIGDLADTLSDLFMDTLGASLFAALHLLRSADAKKVEYLAQQVPAGNEEPHI